MVGTVVNAAAIAAGAAAGMALRHAMPDRMSRTIMQGLGIFTLSIGVSMSLGTKNPILVVVSLVLGSAIGEWLDIESRLDSLGRWVEGKLGGGDGYFAKGFVVTSLLFCVGPMAILGSIEDGLRGNHQILFTKSMMDGIASIALASGMGIGVLGSAVSVFIYQGALTLLAVWAKGLLTGAVATEMTATGGLLILGIGINMLQIVKVKVGNMLPAIFLAAAFAWAWKLVGM